MSGNVFLKGAKSSKYETESLFKLEFDPALNLVEKPDGLYLEITTDKAWSTDRTRKLVIAATTLRLPGPALRPTAIGPKPDTLQITFESGIENDLSSGS